MDVKEEIKQELSSTCSSCKHAISLDAIYCEHCGYPENGTEEDVLKYKRHMVIWSNRLKEAKKKVNSATNTLFILAGLCVLGGIILLALVEEGGSVLLAINLIVAAVYGGLGVWSKDKPVPALMTSLIIFITLMLLNFIAEPESIFHGIIIKIFVLSALVKGLISAREGQSIMEELPESYRKWN